MLQLSTSCGSREPHLLQKRGESRLGVQLPEHGADAKPGQIRRALGVRLLQARERLHMFADADVHLSDFCRRDVPGVGDLPELVQDTPRTLEIARDTVKIAEGRQDFRTASGEADRGLQLCESFSISGELGAGGSKKEPSQAETFLELDGLRQFSRGVVDTRRLVYYLSGMALFLFLSTVVLSSKKETP